MSEEKTKITPVAEGHEGDKQAKRRAKPQRRGSNQTFLATVLILGVAALAFFYWVKWNTAQLHLTEEQQRSQRVAQLLIAHAGISAQSALESARANNFGDAIRYVTQTTDMLSGAKDISPVETDSEHIANMLKDAEAAKAALNKMDPGAADRIQGIITSVHNFEMTAVADALEVARQRRIAHNTGAAQQAIEDAATMFERAAQVSDSSRVRDQPGKDDSLVDQMIRGFAKAQEKVNDTSEEAVKRIDELSQQLTSVRFGNEIDKLEQAKKAIAAGDFSQAQKWLEDTSTMFEKANEVQGEDPANRTLTDDIVRGLGIAQKKVNDKAADAAESIDELINKLKSGNNNKQ